MAMMLSKVRSGMVGKPFVIGFFGFFGPDRAQRSIAFLSV